MSGFVGRNNAKISNRPSGGGDKLQGLPATTDKRTSSIRAIQNRAWGENRNLIFNINQLGGIGRHRSQFLSNAGGVSGPNVENPEAAGGGNDIPNAGPDKFANTFIFDSLPLAYPSNHPFIPPAGGGTIIKFNMQRIPHSPPTSTSTPPQPTCGFYPPGDMIYTYPNPSECADNLISNCPASSFLQIDPPGAINMDLAGGFLGIRVCDDTYNYLGYMVVGINYIDAHYEIGKHPKSWVPAQDATDTPYDPCSKWTGSNAGWRLKSGITYWKDTDEGHDDTDLQVWTFVDSPTGSQPLVPGHNSCLARHYNLILKDDWAEACPYSAPSSITIGPQKWYDDYHTDPSVFATEWVVDGHFITQNVNVPGAGAGGRLFLGQDGDGACTSVWDGGIQPPTPPDACGWAKTGQWQIDIRLGHQDKSCWCETFYLAGRTNTPPSAAPVFPFPSDGCLYYADGQPGGGRCTEIDICETRWSDAAGNPCLGHNTNVFNFGQRAPLDAEGHPIVVPIQGNGGCQNAPTTPGTWMTCGARVTETKVEVYYKIGDGFTGGEDISMAGYQDVSAGTTHDQMLIPYIGTWCTCKVGDIDPGTGKQCECSEGANSESQNQYQRRYTGPSGPNTGENSDTCNNSDTFQTFYRNFTYSSTTSGPLLVLPPSSTETYQWVVSGVVGTISAGVDGTGGGHPSGPHAPGYPWTSGTGQFLTVPTSGHYQLGFYDGPNWTNGGVPHIDYADYILPGCSPGPPADPAGCVALPVLQAGDTLTAVIVGGDPGDTFTVTATLVPP